MTILYIEQPTDADIHMYKDLMKGQELGIFREEINVWTKHARDILTFAFLEVDKKHRKVRGLAYCSYDHYQPSELHIQLVCVDRYTSLATPLLNAVESKARELGVNYLFLECIDTDGLREWYESLGFKYIITIFLRRDIPKFHKMSKFI
jgi:N-acetylglutamate synthase-like GNAT family acetyltransferase